MTRSVWSRRLAATVAAIAGVTAFAGLPAPQVAGAAQGWHVDTESDARTAELSSHGLTVERRMAYKEQLVADLLEHRYTLDQVAREFLAVIAEDETNLRLLRAHFPGRTDEERAARNVIAYVGTQPLPDYEAARAVAHLQAEFRRLYPAR